MIDLQHIISADHKCSMKHSIVLAMARILLNHCKPDRMHKMELVTARIPCEPLRLGYLYYAALDSNVSYFQNETNNWCNI